MGRARAGRLARRGSGVCGGVEVRRCGHQRVVRRPRHGQGLDARRRNHGRRCAGQRGHHQDPAAPVEPRRPQSLGNPRGDLFSMAWIRSAERISKRGGGAGVCQSTQHSGRNPQVAGQCGGGHTPPGLHGVQHRCRDHDRHGHRLAQRGRARSCEVGLQNAPRPQSGGGHQRGGHHGCGGPLGGSETRFGLCH